MHMLSFEVSIILLLFCTRKVFDVNKKAKHFCINKTTHLCSAKHPKSLCLVLISLPFFDIIDIIDIIIDIDIIDILDLLIFKLHLHVVLWKNEPKVQLV